ncbi:MAG TPA: tRNA (N6-threonylcarbamoyladenosine(37)-N6)-methyltransferase TrmO [Desulfuromonadales bacterium]|nr:tRNA (N6-threonylcarbamoyladenosine(37)-N6)-methyltransferase TrmO [Desulfuromonadales bacterium]
MNTINLQPIGVVHSVNSNSMKVPLQGGDAVIELLPQYEGALERIEENSHVWILSWFHEARRDVLTRAPTRVNPDAPSYGVFALRTPARPNPIALTLVALDRIEGNCLYVSGLDALDGTSVLDIKPYYEQDIVFSPRTSKITASIREMRKAFMEKEAIRHHRENCDDMRLAVRMALIAEEQFGKLNDDEILVEVNGSNCLGDTLQGISRARLANPPRFKFRHSADVMKSTWVKGNKSVCLELRDKADLAISEDLADEVLFRIETVINQ